MFHSRAWWLALAALAPGLAGCDFQGFRNSQASAEVRRFQEFAPPEGRFTVLMPGTPERKDLKVLDLTCVGYGLNVNNGAYAVGYLDLPRGRSFSKDGAVQGICSEHQGKVLSKK